MKHRYLKTTKQFKGKVAIAELQRAHFIIALLSLSLGFLLFASSMQPIQLNGWLVFAADALLLLVAGISLGIAFALSNKK